MAKQGVSHEKCALLPDPNTLHLLHLEAEQDYITAVVITTAPVAACPLCQHPSSKTWIANRYQTTIGNLTHWMNQPRFRGLWSLLTTWGEKRA